WIDGFDNIPLDDITQTASALSRYLLYSLTLPERAVRSTIGLAAGAARESAAFLVPQAFQSAKTYELVVHNALGFLTEQVGGVKPAVGADTDASDTDAYIARKAVGNFVDLAGLATLHVSPVWFMAIFSDVAYVSKTYVRELAQALEQKGLISDSSTIHHVDDILQAVQDASGQAATLFDTPPLSVDELRSTLDKTRTALASADYKRILPEAELNEFWNGMRQVAEQENQSLLGVSGAITMQMLDRVGTVSRGTLTGVQVVGGLFSRHVVGHYTGSLRNLRENGFYETLQKVSGPYSQAVWTNFQPDNATLTEELVSGRAIAKAVQSFRSWLSSKPDSSAQAEHGDDATHG
ncbi:MAG: hypothetical protein ABGZ17_02800, partial [Planctomycetaceae bacterium]